MIVLAVDFGLKKIGLAIAEENLAMPLRVLTNDSRIFGQLAQICQKEEVGRVVIGQPEGKIGRKAVDFGKKLASHLEIPIVFHAEVLTTREAIAKMIEAGKKRKGRREKEDAVAAALILQEYLDRQNEKEG